MNKNVSQGHSSAFCQFKTLWNNVNIEFRI